MTNSAFWLEARREVRVEVPCGTCSVHRLGNSESAIPQSRNNFPTPPELLDPKPADKVPDTPTRRLDLDRLQREADDLSRNAQSIPSDVASIRKGMLPKDVIEQLKQIEKLSKHMRMELNP